MMRSSAFERRMLFQRGGEGAGSAFEAKVLPLELASIVPGA